jgi:peptidoglycan-associated lipoprotein
MLSTGILKKFRFAIVGGALLLAVGCAQQTVKSDESSNSASKSMMEAERMNKTAAFKTALSEFGSNVVYFDFDKSGIRADMRSVMDQKAQFLLEYPSVRIQIEGHCDERGTAEYNVALGHRRAQSTKKYLVSLGVSASRIDSVSYGEERPDDPRHHELAWAKNRRAKFNVIGGIPAGMN